MSARIIRKAITATALAGAAICMTVSSANAQREQTRQGFFIGGGLGYGGLDLTCEGCEVDRESSVSGYLKLGGALSQNLLIGGQTNGWYKKEEGVTVTQGSLSANVWWYPSATGGFWVTGGAGFARMDADAGIGGSDNESGFSALGGLGYDLRVGKNISIVPSATWQFAFYDNFNSNLLQLALGITFH